MLCCVRRLFPSLSDSSVHGEHVNAGQTDKIVDQPGEKAGFSEQGGDKIKLKKSDQSPDHRTDDGKCESDIINPFHDVHLLSVFCKIQYILKMKKHSRFLKRIFTFFCIGHKNVHILTQNRRGGRRQPDGGSVFG